MYHRRAGEPISDRTAAPSFSLPAGFIELPAGEVDEETFRTVAGELTTWFGLGPNAPIDQGIAETTVLLLTTGAAARAGGAFYTAAGIFRSPEQSDRPLMVLVNCFAMESDHAAVEDAVAGLVQANRETATGPVRTVELPCGQAVTVENTKSREVAAGEAAVELTEHTLTAWIPADRGIVYGIAVSSHNTEDWQYILDMTEGVLRTVEWDGGEPQGSSATAARLGAEEPS